MGCISRNSFGKNVNGPSVRSNDIRGRQLSGMCTRCLGKRHSTFSCRNLVTCHICNKSGHYKVSCSQRGLGSSFLTSHRFSASFHNKFVNAKWQSSPSSWFKLPASFLPCGPSSPPIYTCFAEFFQEMKLRGDSSPLTTLSLFTKPHLTINSSPGSLKKPSKQPASPTHPLQTPAKEATQNSAMAYHHVDPTPFLPQGFVAEHVQHREIMVCTITHPQTPTHDDWVIVQIAPLPEHEINFQDLADTVREYLVEVRNVQIRAIQRTHQGQALVRFRFVFDRDNLVAMGPRQALGLTFTNIPHNASWNQRGLDFNQDCWLMLLGFPLDF